MENNEYKFSEKTNDIISISIGLILFGIFLLLYYYQEKRIESKLESCSVITIAYPKKFVPNGHIYYNFTLNNLTIEDSYTIPFPTMGKFHRNSTLLSMRFWIRVYCDDYEVNKIYWDANVPDTLQFIPKNGWKEIPYGIVDFK